MGGSDFCNKVYWVTKKIPGGKVATYGQIAAMVGNPRAARAVGQALHANRDRVAPCHRVVGRTGRLAQGYAFGGPGEQKRKLLVEGVKFKDRNNVDLEKCLWRE